mgnify:CR=1 FL=1
MIFAGKYLGTIKEELSIQAENDGTFKYLDLQNMLPWEENFQRIARSSCGCVFYEDNSNNRVGIPNRIFEYMYCGLPILVSDFPELRNIVEKYKCGLVVNSEKPEEIAKAINKIFENPIEASKMGERGKRAIEQDLGYHVDLKKLEKLYLKILKK